MIENTRFPGFAPTESTARNAARVVFVVGLVPVVATFVWGMPGLLALTFLLWVLGSAIFNPCKIHVGADGLLVATRIAPTFVPWSEVLAVEPYPRGVMVRRRSGDLVIPLMAGNFVTDKDRANQKALLTRASEALEAYRRGEEPEVAVRVARGVRPHAEWMRDLFDREGTFRTAPLLDDQLWSVVESPNADPTARAGAAAVLARTAGEAERARLRIAAEGCTAPQLRIVLERTAEGASTSEVEEALVAVETTATSSDRASGS